MRRFDKCILSEVEGRTMRLHRFPNGLLLATILTAGLALACTPSAVGFQVASVSPSQIQPGRSGLLMVTGSGFRAGDQIKLNSKQLQGTTWVNDATLSAMLPTDLPAGRYDVIVTDSDGREAYKPGALEVVAPTQAFAPPTSTFRASTPATAARTPAPAQRPQAQQAAAINVSGDWDVVDTIDQTFDPSPTQPFEFADIALQQSGNQVSGSGSGITALQGTLNGLTLQANYTAHDGTSGTFAWTFSSDGSSFSGRFTSTAPNGGTSVGSRISATIAPAPASPINLRQAAPGRAKPAHGGH